MSLLRSASVLVAFTTALAACGSEDRAAPAATTPPAGSAPSPAPSGPPSPQPAPFSFTITSAVAPNQELLPSGRAGQPDRPVAAYADSNGIKTDFVADEVSFRPKDQADLDAFLLRHDGVVVGTNAVPDRPGHTIAPGFQTPTVYAVRVRTLPPASALLAEGQRRAMVGAYEISSELGAQLLTLIAAEANSGADVSPNWVYAPHAMFHESIEGSKTGDPVTDAFRWYVFRGPEGDDSNHSSVSAAWQYLAARGIPAPVEVAILDGGFWLDATGNPLVATSGIGTDLPANLEQYDFGGDDYFADGENPNLCTGKTKCPWHGNNSASVATGAVNNGAGFAGTGGQVATPVLFKLQITSDQVSRAVLTAAAWGLGVASMSFGGSCNGDCFSYRAHHHYYESMQKAVDAGVVLVASAGNDKADVYSNSVQPCILPGVICVGALEDNKNTAIGYSNSGQGLDIWAPTNIPTMPHGESNNELSNGSGTSASAPFVAGVAAMMKAANPALTSDQVAAIILDTAWKDSADPKVNATGYLNALAAVRKAAGELPLDVLEPNDTPNSSRAIAPGSAYDELTLQTANPDYYGFTLADYTSAYFDVEYMQGLGAINVQVQAVDSTLGAPTSAAVSANARGYAYSAMLAPGAYRMSFSALASAPYNLNLNFAPAGLDPDSFESNESTGTAAEPNAGTYPVSLHTAADVDFYRFSIPEETFSSGAYYAFSALHADLGVNVVLYDASTSAVAYSGSGRNFDQHFNSFDDGKTYLAQVTGPKTRYQLSFGRRVNWAGFALETELDPASWGLDPIDQDALMGVIRGRVDWVVIPGSYAYDFVELNGTGLGLELYNQAGTLLGRGVDMQEAGGTPYGQRLSVVGRLSPGQPYALKIIRIAGAAVPADGSPAFLPAIDYQLSVRLH